MNAIVFTYSSPRFRWPRWLLDSLEAERGRLVPWLAVFAIAGDLLYFALPREPPVYAGVVMVAGMAVLLVLLRPLPSAHAAAAALLLAAFGFASAQLATHRAPPVAVLPRTAVILTGTVSAVEQFPGGRRLTLAAPHLGDGPALPRSLHVRLRETDSTPAEAGDTIRVRTLLRPPAAPAYPGAWDLQRDAFFAGLGGAGVALGPAERVGQGVQPEAATLLRRVREEIAGRFIAGLPGPEGAVAAVLFTGLGAALPAADRAAFRDSGLAHLLAVAGLHIGIVMGLVAGGVRFLLACWERTALRWPCKQVAVLSALGAGAVYVLMTGMHLPVLRAFAMASLAATGIALGRRALSMRALALAAIVLIGVAPSEVLGVSFQMSFAAVLALIAGYEAMRPALARLRQRAVLHHAATLVLTSLLAGAASAPFGAYHFGRVQAYFILANLLAVPLTAAVAMPAGLLALALMPLGLEQVALWPMGWGIAAILFVARTFASLPAAIFAVPHMPGWGLAMTGLGMAWLGLWWSRLRLAGVPVIVAGLLSGLVSPPADILVASEARLIALRDPAYLQSRPGAQRFVLEAWEQYWAEALATPFPEGGTAPPVSCSEAGCRVERDGAAVLLAREDKPAACTGVAAVISAEPAAHVCPGLPRVDRFSVWQDGAYAVWLRGGAATLLSDRGWRGDRPWVPPPPPPARPRTTLPLAALDTAD